MGRPKSKPVAQIYEVDSFSEYLDAVKQAQSEVRCWPWTLSSKSDGIWYRGHSSARWKVLPSLYRPIYQNLAIRRQTDLKRKDAEIHAMNVYERTLFVKFQNGAYSRGDSLPEQNDVSRWLSLMRHYGLPTRLLDWSKSPLVAAYFAMSDTSKTSPVVWVLDSTALNNFHETVAPTLIFKDSTPDERLSQHLSDVKNDTTTAKSILAVEPPGIDPRMVAQKAVFTIHGNRNPLPEYRIGRPYLAKIKFTESGASSVRDHLRTLGYNNSSLFPDLDNLAAELIQDFWIHSN